MPRARQGNGRQAQKDTTIYFRAEGDDAEHRSTHWWRWFTAISTSSLALLRARACRRQLSFAFVLPRPASRRGRLSAECAVGSRIPNRRPSGDALLWKPRWHRIAQIERLMRRSRRSAAILEFQAALLADTELISPACMKSRPGERRACLGNRACRPDRHLCRSRGRVFSRPRRRSDGPPRSVLRNLSEQMAKVPLSGPYWSCEDITPTRFLETTGRRRWNSAGRLNDFSHVAMLARSRASRWSSARAIW